MSRRWLVTVVVTALFGFGANAFAGMNEFESCRCGNWIASKGDSQADVQQKCGKPVSRTQVFRRDCREIWVYNFGQNEFMQGVCFEDGKVKKVISLDHGY